MREETGVLPLAIDSADQFLDPVGVGLKADPELRNPKHVFAPHGLRSMLAQPGSTRKLLISRGVVNHRGVLNTTTARLLRSRLRQLERSLASLARADLRWCTRSCKNMFFFAPSLRAFAHTIGSAFAAQLGSKQLYLMNDEVLLSVHGEPHFDSWQLATNAWQSLPADAWGWTIYIPLDQGSKIAGGGWLRFRDKHSPSTEFDESFGRGDVLVFDRWTWHRFVDFTRRRQPQLAYILRVTNDTRFSELPLSPKYQPALRRVSDVPNGWQINYYCRPHPSHPKCRPPLVGAHAFPSDQMQYRVSRFEINADEAAAATRADCDSDPQLSHSCGRSAGDRAKARSGPLLWLSRALRAVRSAKKIDDWRPVLWSGPRAQPSRCAAGQDLPTAFPPPLAPLGQAASRSLWLALKAASADDELLRGGADCRNVSVSVPPAGVAECTNWVHCVRPSGEDAVSEKIVDNQDFGGFPDCVMLLPLMAVAAAASARAHAAGGKPPPSHLSLDVGANIGACAMLMAAAGWHVAAFEPVASNRRYLLETQRQNPMVAERLVVLPYALGSEDTTMRTVSQAGNHGNSQLANLKPGGRDSDMADDANAAMVSNTGKASVRRLDSILPRSQTPPPRPGSIALMKVDVQGFEYHVFAGGRRLLASGAVGALFFECEGQRLELHSPTTPKLASAGSSRSEQLRRAATSAAATLYGLVRGLGFSLFTAGGERIDDDPHARMLMPCGGNGFGSVNVFALHDAVYDATSQATLAGCLRRFTTRESTPRHNLSSLATHGACARLIMAESEVGRG